MFRVRWRWRSNDAATQQADAQRKHDRGCSLMLTPQRLGHVSRLNAPALMPGGSREISRYRADGQHIYTPAMNRRYTV
jgi:phosphatidate phosphatase APP1